MPRVPLVRARSDGRALRGRCPKSESRPTPPASRHGTDVVACLTRSPQYDAVGGRSVANLSSASTLQVQSARAPGACDRKTRNQYLPTKINKSKCGTQKVAHKLYSPINLAQRLTLNRNCLYPTTSCICQEVWISHNTSDSNQLLRATDLSFPAVASAHLSLGTSDLEPHLPLADKRQAPFLLRRLAALAACRPLLLLHFRTHSLTGEINTMHAGF